MALNGYLTKFKFRESLGVLGLENASYLADRIFLTIDEDYNGLVFKNNKNSFLIIIKTGYF